MGALSLAYLFFCISKAKRKDTDAKQQERDQFVQPKGCLDGYIILLSMKEKERDEEDVTVEDISTCRYFFQPGSIFQI
jgi:hypothetical protein